MIKSINIVPFYLKRTINLIYALATSNYQGNARFVTLWYFLYGHTIVVKPVAYKCDFLYKFKIFVHIPDNLL